MTSPLRVGRPALPCFVLAVLLTALLVSGCDEQVTPPPAGVRSTTPEARRVQTDPSVRAADAQSQVPAKSAAPPAAPMGDRMIAPEPEVVVLHTEGVREFRASVREFLDSVPPDSRKAVMRSLGERFLGQVEQRVKRQAQASGGGEPSSEQILFGMLDVLESFDGLEAQAVVQQFRAENPDWDPNDSDADGMLGGSGSRKNANESAAIATLKNIASAQAQCQASGVIDVNKNGAGEFGTFAELSGAIEIRGSKEFITPPVLSAAFGNVDQGRVTRSGYVFQMWLPQTSNGVFAPENPKGGIDTYSVNAALSEVIWRCYAWPVEHGKSGHRAFVVNQNGDVLACRNPQQWSGPLNGPSAEAASGLEPWSLVGNGDADHGVSGNGTTWTVVR